MNLATERFKLALVNLGKEYNVLGRRTKVLEDVNGTLESGTIVALVGENGSGKSTLLMILATVAKPTSGNVLLDGESVFSRLKVYRRLVTYIPEEPPFVRELSVLQNLRYFKAIYGSERDEVEFAERIGLAAVLDKKPTKLSRGYRQRLALAVGLLKDSRIVLLDEPAEGLDVETKGIVKNIVRNLRSEGKLVVYVTHDDDEIEGVADYVVMLRRGRVVFFDSVERFWEKFGRFYAVTFRNGREKVSRIVLSEELPTLMSKYEVTHIRALGLREIVNLGLNEERILRFANDAGAW